MMKLEEDKNLLKNPVNSNLSDMQHVSNEDYSGEIRRVQDYQSNNYGQLYDANEKIKFSCCEVVLSFFAWLLVIIIPIFWFFIIRSVRNYERALIFRLGKLTGKSVGPGVFLINPLTDEIHVIDLRIQTFDLPPQSMMTRDTVTVFVDAICFMKVMDPIKCKLEVDDYRKAFNNFAATTLRSVIGTYDLQALLSRRDEINERIRSIIESETSHWGVAVPAVEIKDVKLPENLTRAMAAEAEAERERRAKVISARGEAEASTQLAEAAKVINSAPGALQIRYLHTLVHIAAEKNSTILFPLPMEIMRGIQTLTNIAEDYQKQQQHDQKLKAQKQEFEFKQE